MRNKSYIKRGDIIETQIRDEYYLSANILPIDNEKTEFKCNLSIRDVGSGFTEELDQSFIIKSTYKTIYKDAWFKMNEMIDNNYFDEDVDCLDNLMKCMNLLLELQKTLKGEKNV